MAAVHETSRCGQDLPAVPSIGPVGSPTVSNLEMNSATHTERLVGLLRRRGRPPAQWAQWWENPSVDRLNRAKPGAWYPGAMGNYRYEPRWGGREALTNEVQRVRRSGGSYGVPGAELLRLEALEFG